MVGNAVEKAFQPLVEQLNNVENLTVNLAPLNSEYWGQEITVTGLLTGEDLVSQLKHRDLGDGILLPSMMLKDHETVFLDDLSIEDVSTCLKIPIIIVDSISDLLKNCY